MYTIYDNPIRSRILDQPDYYQTALTEGIRYPLEPAYDDISDHFMLEVGNMLYTDFPQLGFKISKRFKSKYSRELNIEKNQEDGDFPDVYDFIGLKVITNCINLDALTPSLIPFISEQYLIIQNTITETRKSYEDQKEKLSSANGNNDLPSDEDYKALLTLKNKLKMLRNVSRVSADYMDDCLVDRKSSPYTLNAIRDYFIPRMIFLHTQKFLSTQAFPFDYNIIAGRTKDFWKDNFYIAQQSTGIISSSELPINDIPMEMQFLSSDTEKKAKHIEYKSKESPLPNLHRVISSLKEGVNFETILGKEKLPKRFNAENKYSILDLIPPKITVFRSMGHDKTSTKIKSETQKCSLPLRFLIIYEDELKKQGIADPENVSLLTSLLLEQSAKEFRFEPELGER